MISDPAHLEASEALERAVFLGTLLHTEIMLDMFWRQEAHSLLRN